MARRIEIAIVVCCALLAGPAWTSDVGVAGSFLEGYREGQARARDARLQQLQLEEAERNAEVQKLEHQQRMNELRAGRVTSGQPEIRTIEQVANDLRARAPLPVDGRAYLTEAASFSEEDLYITLSFPDHRLGSAGGDEGRLAAEGRYVVGLACQEPSIRKGMTYAGTVVTFVLTDQDQRVFGTKAVVVSDCP